MLEAIGLILILAGGVYIVGILGWDWGDPGLWGCVILSAAIGMICGQIRLNRRNKQ